MMLRYILLILLFIDVDGIEVRVGDVVSVNHRQAVVDGRNKDGSVDLYYTDNGSYHRNIKKNQLSSVVMSFTSKKEETSHFKSAFVDKLTHSQSNLLYRLAKLFNLEEEDDDELSTSIKFSSYSLLPSFDKNDVPSSTFDRALLDLHGDLSKYHNPSYRSAKETLENLAQQGHSSAQRTLGLLPPSPYPDNDEARRVLLLHFSSLASDPHAQLAMGYRHMYGIGVPKRCETALSFYRAAAESSIVPMWQNGLGFAIMDRMRLRARHMANQKTFHAKFSSGEYEYLALTNDAKVKVPVSWLLISGVRYIYVCCVGYELVCEHLSLSLSLSHTHTHTHTYTYTHTHSSQLTRYITGTIHGNGSRYRKSKRMVRTCSGIGGFNGSQGITRSYSAYE